MVSTFGAMMSAMALTPGIYPMQVIEGKFPEDITGYSFVVGPAPKPGLSFFHTPGMVHRLNLTPNSDDTLNWQAGYIISEGMQVVSMLPPEVRQNQGLMMMIGMISNAANTALVPIQDGRMLATFDVGRPVEIDPINLRYLSGVGYHREWKAFLPGVVQPAIRTPAHPYYDQAEKQLYTINYTSAAKNGTSLTENELDMWIARWDGEGAVHKWHVSNANFTQYVHESLTTKNFVVWLDAAVFLTEPGARFGLPRTRPQNPYTDVAIVRKSDLKPGVTDVKATVVRIPLEAGHMIADYEDDGKNLTIYLAHANGTELPITVQADDTNFFTGAAVDPSAVGMYTQTDATPYGKYVIEVERGEVIKSQLINDPERFWGLSLQARDIRPEAIGTNKTIYMTYLGHDPLCVTQKMMNFYGNHPYRIVPADKMPNRLIPSLLTQVDMVQMETVDIYEFAPGLVNSSPVFIPDTKNGAGYVLTQVWDDKSTQLWLFDGSKIGAGPVAKLANPSFRLPFTVHTAWLPELKPRTSKYHVDFAEDIGNDYKLLPDFIRQAVDVVIKERTVVA
jgi:all-trans-8'-apo-beta-carotenal 15,15'-oxygenase